MHLLLVEIGFKLEKNHNGVKIFMKSNQNSFFTSAISRKINFGIRNTGNLRKRTLNYCLSKKNREIVGLLEFKCNFKKALATLL